MFGFSSHLRYFLCCKEIDMRNGFDGLSGIVRNSLGKDPISGDVFIFINRVRTHIKILYWDGDGFALYYKRLERGRYAGTTDNDLSKQINREELMMLLEGLSFKEITKKKRYSFS
ncbi:MAG: IS66 family insertion sequence element accessory protein TnpB [Bacteroidales bacterium]